jgi:hypothetical protein
VSRVTFSLLVLFAATAFAPAPFYRAERRDDEINYRTFQGKWRVVSVARCFKDGRQRVEGWPFDEISIEGTSCVFDRPFHHRTPYSEEDLASVPIVIDGAQTPAAFDLGIAGDETVLLGRGIIRRKGDRVVIVLAFGDQARADSFESPPERHFVLTLQRQR